MFQEDINKISELLKFSVSRCLWEKRYASYGGKHSFW